MNEANAKKLLFTVADVLENVGLEFSLSCGTCLGAVREKKFIKIDQDIDLAVLLENFQPIAKNIRTQLIEKGIQIEIIDHRHSESWDGSIYAIKFQGYGEHGDLASYMKIKGKRAIPSHLQSHWFVNTANFLEELSEIEFYGRNFKIPKDVDGYLTEVYGNWQIPNKKISDCRWLCKKLESWKYVGRLEEVIKLENKE